MEESKTEASHDFVSAFRAWGGLDWRVLFYLYYEQGVKVGERIRRDAWRPGPSGCGAAGDGRTGRGLTRTGVGRKVQKVTVRQSAVSFVTSSGAGVGERREMKYHLYVFISGEGPTELGGEGGFPDSPLPAQYEDFPFDPSEPLVDHWNRRRVLGCRLGLTGRTDVLVRTPFAGVHLARQVRFCAWTVVGRVRRHVRRLLYGDHR